MTQMGSVREGGFGFVNVSRALDLQALQQHFHTLPQDPYVSRGFRYKQLTRCRINGGAIKEQEHGPLFQPGPINPVHGGLLRFYDRFPRLDLAAGAVRQFAELCGIDEQYEVLVQPHRITCEKGSPGQPAVEGFHRDGIDYMAILCVSRHQIVGGETQLARALDGPVSLNRTLEVGEMLVVDDRAWFHYTTEIEACVGSEGGYRDVLLLSCSPGRVNRA